MQISKIKGAIINDPENRSFSKKKWKPVFSAHRNAKILIVGQAPGKKAQETGTPWNDLSGDNLRKWLGVDRKDFYNEKKVALVPMDFYFPGSKERGDIAPRKGFAEKWHPQILREMPKIKIVILIGQYSQKYYLGNGQKSTLTNTVKAFSDYLPKYFPLVHPSPRNNIWQKKNPWFEKKVLPELKKKVKKILG